MKEFIQVLGSGSKGNCYIIDAGDEQLIIEAGIKDSVVRKALGDRINTVAGCLISHEHADHCEYDRHINLMGIPLYASAKTLDARGLDIGVNVFTLSGQTKIGGFDVLPFPVNHDAAEPLGFLIRHEAFGKLLFATDTYWIDFNLTSGFDTIMIECNYDTETLKASLQAGETSQELYDRVISSHFGLENLIKWFDMQNLTNTKRIILLHMSDERCDLAKCVKAVSDAIGIKTQTAKELI